MNDRLIRASITRSPSLHQCSLTTTLFWPWLTMAADATGRFEATPRLLRTSLFPLRDDVSDADIESWLVELEATDHITRWTLDGRKYGEIKSFQRYQKLRYGRRSAIPHPSDEAVPEQAATAERRLPSDVKDALEQAMPGRVTDRALQTCVTWLYGRKPYTAQEVVFALSQSVRAADPMLYAAKILANQRASQAVAKAAPPEPERLPSWEESLNG